MTFEQHLKEVRAQTVYPEEGDSMQRGEQDLKSKKVNRAGAEGVRGEE